MSSMLQIEYARAVERERARRLEQSPHPRRRHPPPRRERGPARRTLAVVMAQAASRLDRESARRAIA